VVVLAISAVNTILADEPSIAYSSGKLLHSLPVHTIAMSLGGGKSSALPIFHAIAGYNGSGEKSVGSVESVFRNQTSSQSTGSVTQRYQWETNVST